MCGDGCSARCIAFAETVAYPLFHFGTQLDGLAVNDESAIALMMYGAGMLLGAVDPRFYHLKDEDPILCHELCVDDLAF
jgi:hypothetical protein